MAKKKKKTTTRSVDRSNVKKPGSKRKERSKKEKGGKKLAVPTARKYAFEIASRESLLEEIEQAGQPLTHEQLAGVLKIYERADKYEALGRRLGAMVRDGQLAVSYTHLTLPTKA